MKFIDEFRDEKLVGQLVSEIKSKVKKPWVLMEVCGGQTHSIVKFGLDKLLPQDIELIHGPGCPICVTPAEQIDWAIELALMPNTIFCSFGDMLRVPSQKGDLFSAKAKGADVRIVYSPVDAVQIAELNPQKEVVFFAVGFETTAPANAMAAFLAKQKKLKNFSMLVSHVLVPPAIEAILNSPKCRVQGFLAAGHVCTVMGYTQYEYLAEKYKVPMVITGFEPVDVLQGILMCITQLESGVYRAENQYTRSVNRLGNIKAQAILDEVFAVSNQTWRGIGSIEESGFKLNSKYSDLDAALKFTLKNNSKAIRDICKSGLVLQGQMKPNECPSFGKDCKPEHPLGATMVSSEGACSAYYRYRGAQL